MKAEYLSNVHIFPSDLDRMKESETFANCYSVPMGCPDKGETIPLYTLEQARMVINSEPDNQPATATSE